MVRKNFIRQLDITKIPVNVAAFGRSFIVTDAVPRISRDTQERTGTDYEVVCIDFDFEKIKVAIDGPQTLSDEVLRKGHPQVALTGLRASIYSIKGVSGVSIKADGISLVSNK